MCCCDRVLSTANVQAAFSLRNRLVVSSGSTEYHLCNVLLSEHEAHCREVLLRRDLAADAWLHVA